MNDLFQTNLSLPLQYSSILGFCYSIVGVSINQTSVKWNMSSSAIPRHATIFVRQESWWRILVKSTACLLTLRSAFQITHFLYIKVETQLYIERKDEVVAVGSESMHKIIQQQPAGCNQNLRRNVGLGKHMIVV